jgi:hypothetical protein
VALAAALVLPAVALGGTSGGSWASEEPAIDAVACRDGCADLRAAKPGSIVRITGQALQDVVQVVFLGGPGVDDDVRAKPSRTAEDEVVVRVPEDANGGPLRVSNRDGNASEPGPPLDIDRGPTQTKAGDDGPVSAAVDVRRVYFGSKRKARLSFLVRGDRPQPLTIQLVRAAGGQAVAQWTPGDVAPGSVQSVTWDGTDADGVAAPLGRYEFRVYAGAPATARAAQADPPLAAQSFLFLDHMFPVRGKHDYGEGGAAFGAGRGGRSHEGQDVMAACGTPLVAARGGVVKIKQTQSLAGNYVVVDGDGTDLDYVYMHLREPAEVDKGDRVYTGQRIGDVGKTGDASACHLHFELWSGPGWYTGGKPFDPLPSLKAWDAVS